MQIVLKDSRDRFHFIDLHLPLKSSPAFIGLLFKGGCLKKRCKTMQIHTFED
jgi:hypothetical protein